MNSQPFACTECGAMNLPNAVQCVRCGFKHRYGRAQSNNTLRNSLITVGVVLVIPLFCCGLCVIGSNNNNGNRISTNSAPSNIVRLSSTPEVEKPREILPKPSDFKPSKGSKTASVIAENANLRESPNQNAKVVAEVAQFETVEVVKQKSAWFYVNTSAGKGWLHGNTIRLDAPTTTKNTSSELVNPPTPSYLKKDPTPEPDIDLPDYSSSDGYYHRGPRGGCYTISSSGKKRYVSRSKC